MSNLIIEKSKTKPYVNFNLDSGKLEVGGESYPENAIEFYKILQDWLNDNLIINKDKEFEFSFKMVYFNTSSSKAILDILDILEKHHKNGGKVKLKWYYEEDDEDIQESGEEFVEGLSLPYRILPY